MPRDFTINGPCLARVRGRSDSPIGTLSELGLTSDQIMVQVTPHHKDLTAEAWGEVPVDEQVMGAEATVTMNLIHFDQAILEACWQESMASPQAGVNAVVFGEQPLTGQRLGNNTARFTATGGGSGGNHYIGLNLTSPVLLKPWRFLCSYITSLHYPLGAEKSIAAVTWRVIPYTTDPYQGGVGMRGQLLFDRNSD